MEPVLATPDHIRARAAQGSVCTAVASLVAWPIIRRSSSHSSSGRSCLIPTKACPMPQDLMHNAFARGASCRALYETDTSIAASRAQFFGHVLFLVLDRPKGHCCTYPCAVIPNVTDCLCSDTVIPCQARCIMSALSLLFHLVDASSVLIGESRTAGEVARTIASLSCLGSFGG